MNDLTIETNNEQWQLVAPAIREVDEFMAESDAGTLYQKEKVTARKEGRKSRFPSVFLPEEERKPQIAALEQEYRARHIKFRSKPIEEKLAP